MPTVPAITYQLSAAYSGGIRGATVGYGASGQTFDILAALVSGGGAANGVGGQFIVTDSDLITVLDSHPAVSRTGAIGSSPTPSPPVFRTTYSSHGRLVDRPNASAVPEEAKYFATDDHGGKEYEIQGGVWVPSGGPGGILPATARQAGGVLLSHSSDGPTALVAEDPRITPMQRLKCRNDIKVPRGTTLSSPTWQSLLAAFVQDDFSMAPDAAFASRHPDGATPNAVSLTAHSNAVSAWPNVVSCIQVGDSAGGFGIPTQLGDVVFMRCFLRLVQHSGGGNNARIALQSRMYSAGGLVSSPNGVRNLAIFDIPPGAVDTTKIWRIAGWVTVPTSALYCSMVALVSLADGAASGTTLQFKIAMPQVWVDPDTRCDEYVDGTSVKRGVWQNVADNSHSEGMFAKRPDPVGFKLGSNSYAIAYDLTTTPSSTQYLPPDDLVKVYKELGWNTVRGGIAGWEWDLAQPTSGSPINWRNSRIAPFMDAAEKAGLEWMPIVGPVPSWTGNADWAPRTAGDRTIAGQHAAALIATWPNVIKSVEVWNEPNLLGSLGAGVLTTGAQYMDLVKAIYPAVKAQSQSVPVGAGALGRYQSDDASGTSITTFLAAMYANGLTSNCDAISVHPYSDDISSGDPIVAATGFHSGFSPALQQVRAQKIANNDVARPIWITEYGFATASAPTNGQTSASEKQQAQNLMLAQGIALRSDDITAFIVHTLYVPDGDANPTFALMEYQTMRRKEAFFALRDGRLRGNSRWKAEFFSNGWVNALAGFPPSYAELIDPVRGLVEVFIAVKSGTSATGTILTLPKGWAPAYNIPITADSNGVVARASINSDRTVTLVSGASTTGNTIIHELFVAEH